LRACLYIPNTLDCPQWNNEQITEFQNLLKSENNQETTPQEAEAILSQMYKCIKALVFDELDQF
jgi:hypothetical protein